LRIVDAGSHETRVSSVADDQRVVDGDPGLDAVTVEGEGDPGVGCEPFAD
jgi:hypothetical protein